MNILEATNIEENLAGFFTVIGHPVRIQILLVIGQSEACVCHLEAYLGLRQAAMSQHLMALRKAGLLTTRREGRNIFYRLAQTDILDLVRHTGSLLGYSSHDMDNLSFLPQTSCPCPNCNPDTPPGMGCSQLNVLS